MSELGSSRRNSILSEDSSVGPHVRRAVGVLQRVSPQLAARAVEPLFLSPDRPLRPQHEQAALESAQRDALQHEGRRVPLYSWGENDDRPVVMFAHGWAGRATQVAPYLEPLLAAGYRVVSYDVPGHGEGPRALVSLIDFARVALRVVQWVGTEVQAAIGHSVGGSALTVAAAERPFAERIVAIASPQSPRSYLDRFASALALSHETHDALLGRLEARYARRLEQLDPAALAPHTRAHALVVHDRDDHDVPFSHGEQLAAAWPGASFLATAGLGHRRVLRDPAVVRAVVEFVGAPRPSMMLDARRESRH